MADFASFVQRAAPDPSLARGQLHRLRRLQLEFATDCDDLIEALRLLLEVDFDKGGIPFTTVGELYMRCIEIAKTAHLRLPGTLQGFGQRLSNEKQNIESKLDVKYSELRGHSNQRKVELKLNVPALKNWPPESSG